MNVYKFNVANISCSNCAKTIENAVNDKWPDAFVRVNITTGLVVVRVQALEIEVNEVLKKAGYPVINPQDNNEEQQMKREIVLGIILSLPLLLAMLHHIRPFEYFIPSIFTNGYIQWVLATPIQFYLGRRFYRGAYFSLKQKVLGMDFLVALSSTAAYFYSVYLVFNNSQMGLTYFETSALVIVVVLIGKYIEERLKNKMANVVDDLAGLVNDEIRLEDGTKMNVELVPIGTEYVINANEVVNMDGYIVTGETYIDESSLSGESVPVSKVAGNDVMAGTINLGKTIIVKTTKNAEDNVINEIINRVQEATLVDTKYTRVADKIAGYFVPIVLIIALITYIGTVIATADPVKAFEHAITVVIISCPCSLGLATPTSIMVSNSLSAKEGILYHGAKFFEMVDKLDVLCFDKTGTLTIGNPSVKEFNVPQKYCADIYAIEKQSTHPISQTIAKYLEAASGDLQYDVEHMIGVGLKARSDKHEIIIGNKSLISNNHKLLAQINDLEAKAMTVNVVFVDKEYVGYYSVSDQLKPGIIKVVEKLKAKGLKIVMITGDNQNVAKVIADDLDIKEYHANTMPTDKSKIVEELQNEGHLVGFVGDGVNDSIALKTADVAISVENGNAIAIDASDVTLLKEDLNLIVTGIEISRLTRRNIKRNFIWAFSYNIVAVPLAAFGELNMIWAAIFMGFSSIIVLLNALHLRREYETEQRRRNDIK